MQTVDPEQAEKVHQFLNKLKAYRNGESPFTFVVDDISGNSLGYISALVSAFPKSECSPDNMRMRISAELQLRNIAKNAWSHYIGCFIAGIFSQKVVSLVIFRLKYPNGAAARIKLNYFG